MPIVEHKLESDIQSNGSTSNILRMYDQEANEYMISFSAPTGFDLQALVNTKINAQDLQLVELMAGA